MGSGGERAAEELLRVTGGHVLVLCAGGPVQMFREDIPLVCAETRDPRRKKTSDSGSTFMHLL